MHSITIGTKEMTTIGKEIDMMTGMSLDKAKLAWEECKLLNELLSDIVERKGIKLPFPDHTEWYRKYKKPYRMGHKARLHNKLSNTAKNRKLGL